MTIAKLRQIGGSTCITIPKAFLDRLQLKAGESVKITLDGMALRIEPQTPSYTLDGLLAGMPQTPTLSTEEREWIEEAPQGKEIW